MNSDQQRVATAIYALRLVVKNLDQVDSHLETIGNQIPALLRSDATLLYGLVDQSERLNMLHLKLARLVNKLVIIGREDVEREDKASVDDPMKEKDPWETDHPQLASYLVHLDMD